MFYMFEFNKLNIVCLSADMVRCGCCKVRRAKCVQGECIYAPYFPTVESYEGVNRLYGFKRVQEWINNSAQTDQQRHSLANALRWEANNRHADPIRGSYRPYMEARDQIDILQNQVNEYQQQLHTLRLRVEQLQAQQPNAAAQGPPQPADAAQGPPQPAIAAQGPPQPANAAQGPPQPANAAQGPPELLDLFKF
jgi:hypothetical protein